MSHSIGNIAKDLMNPSNMVMAFPFLGNQRRMIGSHGPAGKPATRRNANSNAASGGGGRRAVSTGDAKPRRNITQTQRRAEMRAKIAAYQERKKKKEDKNKA